MKMHTIATKTLSMLGLAIAVMAGGATGGLAQGQMHMGGMANMTREEQAAHHEKMAGMHSTMAGCLKSTKTVDECHKEMQKSCETLHGGKCPMPMMGGHMGGRGKKGGKGGMGMMGGGAGGNGAPASANPDKGSVDQDAAPHAPAK